MEKWPHRINQGLDLLEKRLITAANRGRKSRRGFRLLETDTPPNIRIDAETVNPNLLFIELVEGLEKLRTVPNAKAADMIRANTSLIADYLVDSLWGNHDAFEFVSRGVGFLTETDPPLSGATKRKLAAANERSIKREQLNKKFNTQTRR